MASAVDVRRRAGEAANPGVAPQSSPVAPAGCAWEEAVGGKRYRVEIAEVKFVDGISMDEVRGVISAWVHGYIPSVGGWANEDLRFTSKYVLEEGWVAVYVHDKWGRQVVKLAVKADGEWADGEWVNIRRGGSRFKMARIEELVGKTLEVYMNRAERRRYRFSVVVRVTRAEG